MPTTRILEQYGGDREAEGSFMSCKRSGSLLAGALLVAWLAVPRAVAQERTDPGVMLQAALHQELVDGDLEHAIELYQDISYRP